MEPHERTPLRARGQRTTSRRWTLRRGLWVPAAVVGGLGAGALPAGRAEPAVWAAGGPSVAGVSGPLAHKATLRITGSGFGPKAQAAPLKYDDFDAGIPGDKLVGWAFRRQFREPDYSAAVVRPNSRMSAHVPYVDGEYLCSFGVAGAALSKLYLNAWVYCDTVSPFPRNHKLVRVFSNTPNGSEPNLYYNVYCQAYGQSSVLGQDGLAGTAPASRFRTSVGSWSADDFSKRWVHLALYLEQSSADADDGTAVLWLGESRVVNRVRDWRTRISSATTWSSVMLGQYLGHGTDDTCKDPYGDAHVYWDDVYVDVSRARVEIGDAAAYDACTHREIQIPTAWSDGAVTVTVNQGAFPGLEGRYLFVVDDATGTPSPGFRLGGAAGTPTPTAQWPVLRQGASGETVRSVQYLLRQHGYAVAVDGAFGPPTDAAVRAFQQARGLTVDGVVGPQTWGVLVITVQQGSQGEAVRAAQSQLRARGYTIAVDGDFGTQTAMV
jgi:hypothetical protein